VTLKGTRGSSKYRNSVFL